MDRRKLALLDALKTGSLERNEARLYCRGKLPGLFAQRTRMNAEIADQAVADGLLEITRVETVGKTSVEWVRVTPKGLDYLLEGETPDRVLNELRDLLTANLEGFPTWVAEMNTQIRTHMQRYADEVVAMRKRFEQLTQRVDEAIRNLEAARAPAPPGETPWQAETLEFLARRRQVGLGPRCPLGDLFEWLREKQLDLTIKEFHAGLKRMQDAKHVALLTSTGPGDTPGPEYALLIGSAVYYHVARNGEAAA